MLHLEHHSFARRQLAERSGDSPADFHAHQAPFRGGCSTLFLLPVEKIPAGSIAIRMEPEFRRLIFWPAVPATELVKANISYDAIYPRIETAVETKARQIFINFQEGFLVDVPGIFWPMQNVQCDAQDVTVVAMYERFKRFAIARLRAFD